jgi:methionyl-tRNA formyltransferase
MKVVFFGTPAFAAEVLTYLLENQISVAAVVTKPDKPQGRSGKLQPTPVKCAAENWKDPIPVFQPELVSNPDFAPVLESFHADLFVVVAYGEIIKQHLLDMPKLGCINLHASLLPKYRGAAPIQRCLMEGEKETGITIMHMVKKMDAGDMIKVEKIAIEPDMTYGQLEQAMCIAGKKALLDVIRQFEKGKIIGEPQDHSQATFAPKVELEDCEIFWENSAEAIHNLVRGVNPVPGAWCHAKVRNQPMRLKIWKTKLLTDAAGFPGEILKYGKEGIVIACGKGGVQLLEVQLEGKRSMPAEEAARGLPREQFELLSTR